MKRTIMKATNKAGAEIVVTEEQRTKTSPIERSATCTGCKRTAHEALADVWANNHARQCVMR